MALTSGRDDKSEKPALFYGPEFLAKSLRQSRTGVCQGASRKQFIGTEQDPMEFSLGPVCRNIQDTVQCSLSLFRAGRLNPSSALAS